MTPSRQILAALADAEFHPPATLATPFGLNSAQLSRALSTLSAIGLEIEHHPRHGYRLASRIEPLSGNHILAAMRPESTRLLGTLAIQLQTDSTNSQLRRMLKHGVGPGSACLSESQSAGRGRRGRQWIAPACSNLMLSVSGHYPVGDDLSGLSLALGVAASHALEDSGIHGSQIKWPNDLIWQHRKLGGILIELYPSGAGQITIIAGIGINIHLPTPQGEPIDQPWTDLQRISGQPVARNPLAGHLLHRLLLALQTFGEHNHHRWQQAYRQRDALIGRAVTVTRPDGSRSEGIGRGIDSGGALLIEQHGRISRHPIGEASVKATTSPSPAANAGTDQ